MPKSYGNVIAGRWPIEPIPWPVQATWPQLTAAATIDLPHGRVVVVSTHIPNRSGNGWEKVYAPEALAAGLNSLELPTVLAVEINEPRSFTPVFASFRAEARSNPAELALGGRVEPVTGAAAGAHRSGADEADYRDQFGISHPRQRWQNAVAAVLAQHLDDQPPGWTCRRATAQVGVEEEDTHLVRSGEPRYFDHILTTPELRARGSHLRLQRADWRGPDQ